VRAHLVDKGFNVLLGGWSRGGKGDDARLRRETGALFAVAAVVLILTHDGQSTGWHWLHARGQVALAREMQRRELARACSREHTLILMSSTPSPTSTATLSGGIVDTPKF